MHALTKKTKAATGDFDLNACASLSIAGVRLTAHASGVLWMDAEETLVVADLHLEKGSSFATKQIFLPPYDSTATLRHLSEIVASYRPQRVIALGDSFHDGDGPSRLSAPDRATLAEMVSRTDWIWIAGNHDPALPQELGGTFLEEVELSGLHFRHEPQEAAIGEVAGHFHPSARIRGRGRSVRKRCFIANSERIILPAFGAYTGGLNVCDPAFEPYFPNGNFHAYMMGDEKLYPIAAGSCLPG